MVTDNLNVVRHVADRVAIMYLGRFVETGPTEDVFRQPRHPYTSALLSANPESDPDARMARIELQGDVPSLLKRPSGCEFHTRCFRVQATCRDVVPARGAAGRQDFTCNFPLSDELSITARRQDRTRVVEGTRWAESVKPVGTR